MKRTFFYVLMYIAIIALTGCSKKDANAGLTIESLSGTYGLKALIWESGGNTINVYDQLEACEKDNLVKLNSDKTLNFIDAGIVCSPPENGNSTWDLKGDSLSFSNSNSSKIQNFDGKTLILTGTPDNEPGVKATTTLEKK